MEQSSKHLVEVTVPHLAESLVEATVGKWLKQPGDDVAQYEVICELLTEKVNTEMPSPVGGKLTQILVTDGQRAFVGEALCLIEVTSDSVSADGHNSPASADEPLIAIANNQQESRVAQTQTPMQSSLQSPVQSSVQSSMQSPVQSSLQSLSVASQGEFSAMRYSPAVFKLAAEHDVDIKKVQGTGIGGRVTRKDIEQYIEVQANLSSEKPPTSLPVNASSIVPASSQAISTATSYTTTQATSQATSNTQSYISTEANLPVSIENQIPLKTNIGPVRSTGIHLSQTPPTPLKNWQEAKDDGSETLFDVTPIRSTIASRMRQSLSEIPHAWTMVEVDVTNLVVLRSKVKDEFTRKEGINLTYLAFMIKAVVNAIKDYPIMNSVWAVDKIILKRDINISLAVGTEDSVYTPVIKRADQKNIAGLAKEIDDLTKKARAGKLSLEDMKGGTFTVNNTGSFGSILSYPIINYPQAAIVTFESIVKKPVVIQDMIAVRSMVNLCLSLDHRILDGVICGRFLQRVKENLESYQLDTKLY